MKIFFSMLALFAAASSAFARIGETEAQIEARYGKPTRKVSGAELKGPGFTRIYNSAGITIIVTFVNNVSGSEYYSKSPRGKLEQSEVETILEANGEMKNWKHVDLGHPFYDWRSKRWILGELPNAVLADFNQLDGTLTLCTSAFLDAAGATDKDAAKKKLKGF